MLSHSGQHYMHRHRIIFPGIHLSTQSLFYPSSYSKNDSSYGSYRFPVQQHIDLVKAVKNKVNIPVIASINCLRDGEWISFASELEKAGADALELNAFILPMDEFAESVEVENMYFDIVKHVKKVVKIPVIVKISHYFTNLPAFVRS